MATKPNDNNNLSHTRWNCKYHIVFITKYRRKEIYGKSRKGRYDSRQLVDQRI